MRIVDIREVAVPLKTSMRNAAFDFSEMTTSVVAVITDVVRGGKPVVGYAFAWYAHFFVEHNKPATFGHPFYSLAADYRMLFLMLAGRMDGEVKRFV